MPLCTHRIHNPLAMLIAFRLRLALAAAAATATIRGMILIGRSRFNVAGQCGHLPRHTRVGPRALEGLIGE
jgi:hypothetical protein